MSSVYVKMYNKNIKIGNVRETCKENNRKYEFDLYKHGVKTASFVIEQDDKYSNEIKLDVNKITLVNICI